MGDATTDVVFDIRTGGTVSACNSSPWRGTLTNPAGSDLSDLTSSNYLQYRIWMSSSDPQYTPLITKVGSYAIRITYSVEGTTPEATVPFHWRSGWQDFGYSGYIKSLKKFYAYYESESTGTLTFQFENLDGDTDSFIIDLAENPSDYTNYFTGGEFPGELFRLDITEDSLYDLRIKKIILVFDVEPLV